MNKNKNAIAYNIGSANLIEPPWIRALLFNFKTFQFQLIKIILINLYNIIFFFYIILSSYLNFIL